MKNTFTPKHISAAQHQALGAMATISAGEHRPAGCINMDRWGFHAANTTRRTCIALMDKGLLDFEEDPTTGRSTIKPSQLGLQALAEADKKLHEQVRAEMATDPHAITSEEAGLIMFATRQWGPPTVSQHSWESYDYLTRVRLLARGYVEQQGTSQGLPAWHVTPCGFKAYTMHHRRASVTQELEQQQDPEPAPLVVSLQLELTPQQVQSWREENGLGPGDDVAANLIAFLRYNTLLGNEENWKLR